ncbi:MAG: malto-oligosyltrehalose trehalohydrolase [Chloroflexota bacterium]|nr:malto-oligosyltrehalose trehalohydrolase [Chloroflexota bacterium]
MNLETNIGATYIGNGRVQFLLWAPLAQKVDVHLVESEDRMVPLARNSKGYYHAIVDNIAAGSRYFYRIDGQKERPDPASRFQPQGVHGPSEVIDHTLDRGDLWFGLPLRDYVIYELHVGTFTTKGTFDAIISHLEYLKDLGITAVELMPVAQFPGDRNWGYDGVYPYAAQNSYGGPQGLRRLVRACHQREIALILDVVYNHLGPEGNYLADFAPYFTERYSTPWGKALNFDGPHSDDVRRFFIENALYWITEVGIDALRLDAVHAILDHSPYTFLEQLAEAVHEQAQYLNRQVYLIPESAANDSRLIRRRELGGYGMDGQWNDDFHHCVHVLLTGECSGYYQDYDSIEHLEKAYAEGFVYSGEYSPYRQHRHGSSSKDIPAERFIVFAQNHDQIGNRMQGDRLTQQVSFEALKLAAGLVILSPFIPLLFMGEEYGEIAPFQYFISHSDPKLVEAVRKGRQNEFSAFEWKGTIPNPQSEETFLRCKLNHSLRESGHYHLLQKFYKELLRLRREIPSLSNLSKEAARIHALAIYELLTIHRRSRTEEVFMVSNLGGSQKTLTTRLPRGEMWRKVLDSNDTQWGGQGNTFIEEKRQEEQVAITLDSKVFVLLVRDRSIP